MLLWMALACETPPMDSGTPPIVDTGACEEQVWYVDADGDGFGDDATQDSGCTPPTDSVSKGGDCDDSDLNNYPGAYELCDGVDQDCDDAVDEEPVNGTTWYSDADRDGYGDDSTAQERLCDPPSEDSVSVGGDCEDLDPAIHPGADEVCDGVDNDCDSLTPESGLARFVDREGLATDYSARLKATSPVHTEVLTQDGTLSLCAGTWPLSLRVRANVDLVGIGSVTLDPDKESAAYILRSDGLEASVQNIEIRDGAGVGVVLGEFTAGGGIECSGQSTLRLEQVTVRDSGAGVGAGLWVQGCAVSGEQVELFDNQASYYGGGAAVTGGSLTLQDSEVRENQADSGGGLAIIGYAQDASGALNDSVVEGNSARLQGGGAIVEDADLSCTGAGGSVAGFLSNSADEGGGVYLSHGGTVASVVCDWGRGSETNLPEDISADPDQDWGDDERFSCDVEGCQ